MKKHPSLWPTLLAAGVVVSCGGSSESAAPRQQRAALRVRVSPVAVQDVVYQIKSLGQIEAQDMVQVTAQVEGVATDVRFREGDRVSTSTVLLRIDPDRYRLEAERAKAVLDQAKAERGQAEADLKRREALAQSELLSAEELTRSRSDRNRLAAAVDVSEAAPGIALQNLAARGGAAPIAGTIDTRTVDTGQFVRTGTVLATIVDASRLRLRFKVSEAESLRATVGGNVTFRVAPLGPRDFTARIYHVGRIADATTRQVEVLAWVENPGELKPGFFAEVTLAGERAEARARRARECHPGERAGLRHLRRGGRSGPGAAHSAGAAHGHRDRGDPLRPEAGRDRRDRGLRPARLTVSRSRSSTRDGAAGSGRRGRPVAGDGGEVGSGHERRATRPRRSPRRIP